MSDEIAIRVQNISKDFLLPHEKVNSVKSLFTGLTKDQNRSKETQHALHDISFEVKKGEFFGIVGRNGSGKSTLLKILAGIYQPTAGTTSTEGKLVPFIELGVGFNAELTGRENVYLNGAMLGFSEKEVDAMYKDIVDFAELERFMDQKLKNYSSGMQVRLAFSMATRAEADILLVDEVLAVGDADFQRKCFSYFRNLKKNKKTVVFVSHDMGAVRQYCDRAILIEDSKLVFKGSSESVATEYTRMFNDNTQVGPGAKDRKRWGNQKIVFDKVTVSPANLKTKGEQIIVTASLVAKQDVDNPVLGFVVKSDAAKGVIGTNTRLAKVKTGSWKRSEIFTVSWSFPNIFSDGTYAVDVAVLEEDASTICEWWEGAMNFKSFEDAPSPYEASPIISTSLKAKNDV